MSSSEQKTGTFDKEYVLFKIGGIRCGVILDHVREINRNAMITPVYTADPQVRGVVNLRGQIVTILDLAIILGVESQEMGREFNHLIIESENELIGLMVDEVEDIVKPPAKDVKSPPPHGGGPFAEYLLKVLQLEEGLVRILDVELLTGK